MRRFIAFLTISAGAAVIIFTFAVSSFHRTADAERVLDRLRVTTSAAGFKQFVADYGTFKSAETELVDKAFPEFARKLGMTRSQFDAYVRANFSFVPAAIDATPGVASFIEPIAGNIQALPKGFEPAYDLPIKSLPLTSVPWLLLALGVGLTLAGVAALRWPGLPTTAVILAFGLGMAVVPPAVSLPSRVSDTDRVLRVAREALSARSAELSEQATGVVSAMVEQLRTEMFPTLAARLKLTEPQLEALVARDFPAVSTLLAQFDRIGAGATVTSANIRASVDEVKTGGAFPYTPTTWLVISLGILLFLAAGAGLATGRGSGISRGSG